jgi:hypothetical protein
MDLKVSGRDLFETLSRLFSVGSEEKLRKTSMSVNDVSTEVRPSSSLAQHSRHIDRVINLAASVV